MKILKNSTVHSSLACDKGYGVYSLSETMCSQLKLCTKFDENFSVVSIHKCINQLYFDISNIDCVSPKGFQCLNSKTEFTVF